MEINFLTKRKKKMSNFNTLPFYASICIKIPLIRNGNIFNQPSIDDRVRDFFIEKSDSDNFDKSLHQLFYENACAIKNDNILDDVLPVYQDIFDSDFLKSKENIIDLLNKGVVDIEYISDLVTESAEVATITIVLYPQVLIEYFQEKSEDYEK